MKIATISTTAGPHPAIVVGEHVLDLVVAQHATGMDTGLRSVLDLITDPMGLQQAEALVKAAPAALWQALSATDLLAPIPRPAKNVVCVGRNYKLHIEEGARARGVPVSYPKVPEFFTKPSTAVTGTGAMVRLPNITRMLDYEVELAFIVGRTGRDIPADQALAHIFGFTVLNDITARDLQREHGQWFKGKGLDGTCPIGPWIVTRDAFDVNSDHRLWLTVNGQPRQDALISDMVFDCAQILASLSAGMTVEAGDIITTGTPSGVGLGLDPQVWLADGDVVEAGIDGIGSITNRIQAV